MKRLHFIRTLIGGAAITLGISLLDGKAQAKPTPIGTKVDYLAHDVAIHALNQFSNYAERDTRFYAYIYGLLESYGLDSSWPTAKAVGDSYFQIRNDLITRANQLK